MKPVQGCASQVQAEHLYVPAAAAGTGTRGPATSIRNLPLLHAARGEALLGSGLVPSG